MASVAHRLGKIVLLTVSIRRWPELVRLLFPNISRGELTFSLIILGLIVTITVLVINVLPHISLAKIMVF